MKLTQESRLHSTLQSMRRGFIAAVVFSLAVNLLMLASPLYMLQIYDRVLTSRSLDTLIMLSLILAIALMTIGILEGVRTSLMVRMNGWLDRQLSASLFTASVVGPLRHSSPANVQGLRDLGTFRNFFTSPSIFSIMDAPWAPIYIAVIYLLHPILGSIALFGAFILFSLGVINEKTTRELQQQSNKAQIRALNQANAAVQNADVIEAMGFLPNLIRQWHRVNNENLVYQTLASHRSGILTSTSRFMRLALQSIMLGAGAYFTILGEITPGAMIAATILLGRALSPVEQAIGSWKFAVSARDAFRRIKDQLARTPIRGLSMPLPKPTGKLSVEDMTFAFPSARKALLRNITFQLEPGETLGIIGPTGSGKTTLIRLILGNLVPMAGHARLDGIDMAQWEPEDRGPHIGYLPQDVELFNGTIKANIARMGDADAEAVIKAAMMAGVHEMITHMPNGYDTHIGEEGHALSGGERQRVAFARALYGDPSFIVLDEPNASLDTEGEAALITALKKLKQANITTLIIAHHPAILDHVDKVLMLNDGYVQAFGNRDDVLARATAIHPGSSRDFKATTPTTINTKYKNNA